MAWSVFLFPSLQRHILGPDLDQIVDSRVDRARSSVRHIHPVRVEDVEDVEQLFQRTSVRARRLRLRVVSQPPPGVERHAVDVDLLAGHQRLEA